MQTNEQELRAFISRLRAARTPADALGPGPVANAFDRLSAAIRALAPAHDLALAALATHALGLLSAFRDEAERASRASAPKSKSFIEAAGVRWAVERSLPAGDLCDVYLARDERSPDAAVVLKVARSGDSAGLLDHEIAALHRLWAGPPDDVAIFGRYLPRPLAALSLPDARRVNVLSHANGMVSLAEVQRAYPTGVAGHHLGWIGSRVLELLAWVHRRGVVHGAVLPPHVLVHPVGHGAVLVDWCYAVTDWASDRGPHLAALPSPFRELYAQSVFERAPATPGLDWHLTAETLAVIGGVDLATGEHPKAVPIALVELLQSMQGAADSDTLALYKRWRDALAACYGPPRYHPLPMPDDYP